MFDDKKTKTRVLDDGTVEDGHELTIKELGSQLVMDVQTSPGKIELPQSFLEFMKVLGKPEADTQLEVFALETTHVTGETTKLLFFEDDAMALLVDLIQWASSRHAGGECGCGLDHDS